MSQWPCAQPHFPFDAMRGWYLACTACGRLAWDHEQADPLADIRNTVREMHDGLPTSPPVMRP